MTLQGEQPVTTTSTPTITIDRKQLIAALDRVRHVVPTRFPKPILTGVRLEASDGSLFLAATDGEMKLFTSVAAEGQLPRCVVSCAELVRRVKASKGDACTLSVRRRPQQLIVNGGRVEHALPLMAEADFPLIPDQSAGETLTVDAQQLKSAINVASQAAAREPGRYAINGVLLESDSAGLRLVATDGRRLVIADLEWQAGDLRCQLIIPARVAKLAEKLAAHEQGPLTIAASLRQTDKGDRLPADVYVTGSDWLLSFAEAEGRFPMYRDVVPLSQSKFVIDRQSLIETLQEVSLAASSESQMVRVDLTPRRIQLSAQSPEVGESKAKLPARFIGGGDNTIHTAFRPGYLLDALKSLAGDQVVIDVGQNGCGCDGSVFGKPVIIYSHGDESVRWVVMPVNANLPATRENLGSNYREEAA
jgi:DNA polymerase-3 subunit beta